MTMFSSGSERGAARRIDDQPAAGESLADVIVGVAFEFQRHALGEKRAEALARRAGELEADGVVRQPRRAVPPRDFARQHGAHRAVHVADRQLDLDRRAVFDRLARVIDQLVIERLARARDPAPARSAARCARASADCSRIDERSSPLAFQWSTAGADVQHVHAAHHFVERAEAHLRHVAAHLLGDEEEEIDDVLRRAR